MTTGSGCSFSGGKSVGGLRLSPIYIYSRGTEAVEMSWRTRDHITFQCATYYNFPI